MRQRTRIFMASLSLLTALTIPISVSAMSAPNAKTAADTVGERIRGRLDERHMKVCEAKSAAIKTIMQRAATQGQKNMDVFSKIATRVEQFYVNKKLKVSNYDQLLAAIDAKKTAATTAIATVKSSSGTFNCGAADPVGNVDQFKKDLQAMRQALKDYRSAINNLIVAVKTAAEKGTAQ